MVGDMNETGMADQELFEPASQKWMFGTLSEYLKALTGLVIS